LKIIDTAVFKVSNDCRQLSFYPKNEEQMTTSYIDTCNTPNVTQILHSNVQRQRQLERISQLWWSSLSKAELVWKKKSFH